MWFGFQVEVGLAFVDLGLFVLIKPLSPQVQVTNGRLPSNNKLQYYLKPQIPNSG